MKIDSLKDLQKVIALCRKTGVEAIEIDNVKLNLGPAPKAKSRILDPGSEFPEANIRIPQYNPVITNQSVAETVADVIKTDALTDEELLFYSAMSQGETN